MPVLYVTRKALGCLTCATISHVPDCLTWALTVLHVPVLHVSVLRVPVLHVLALQVHVLHVPVLHVTRQVWASKNLDCLTFALTVLHGP